MYERYDFHNDLLKESRSAKFTESSQKKQKVEKEIETPVQSEKKPSKITHKVKAKNKILHSKPASKKHETPKPKPLESQKLVNILVERHEDKNIISDEENMILELNRVLK